MAWESLCPIFISLSCIFPQGVSGGSQKKSCASVIESNGSPVGFKTRGNTGPSVLTRGAGRGKGTPRSATADYRICRRVREGSLSAPVPERTTDFAAHRLFVAAFRHAG